MKRSVFILLLSVILLSVSCESSKKKGEVLFSYRAIMDKEFRFNVGKVTPVTLEQSVELDGDISLDGKYFYYTSNRELGNYDIYIRLLSDITTLRVTSHPSKDTAPAISPDGKTLAFISTREDPEGDLYTVELNPAKLLKKAGDSISEMPSLDRNSVNLTQFQDPVTKTVQIIKDSTPSWSPDGKTIVFSSKRGGIENIWTISSDGKNLKKLTTKGGMYPKYSPDGTEILFISYRDSGSMGDIYALNPATGSEKRVTKNNYIELMPAYMRNKNEIIYTVIDRDTNNDGKIDLKDNSVLYYMNRATGITYPLTLYSQSSFSAKWLPILETQAYKGIIIYSNLLNDNININLIPETGIIPKWANAVLQYRNANKYLTEYSDSDKYLLGLERVNDFFGKRKDKDSQIYTAKSLSIAAFRYWQFGESSRSKLMLHRLKNNARGKNLYAVTRFNYTSAKLSGKQGHKIISNAIKKAGADSKSKYYIPFLMEDLADEFLSTRRKSESAVIYSDIIRRYPKYTRITSVHSKYSRISDTIGVSGFLPSTLIVLKRGTAYQKIQMAKHLLKIIKADKDIDNRLGTLKILAEKYSKTKNIAGLLYYAIADTYMKRRKPGAAEKYFKLALKNLRQNDILFYRTNTKLGDIALYNKKPAQTEKYLSTAVNRYRHIWKESDINSRIQWLINYYESHGERSEYAGDYAKAAALYKKYSRLMSFLHRRRFTTIYNRYGPRSHILYIDAYTKLHRTKGINQLIKEYNSDLKRKRMDFDKAYIYGIAYLYTLKAAELEKSTNIAGVDIAGLKGLLINFQLALEQVEWAIFLDDTFIEPFLLKSWIYQYIDLKRDIEGGIHDDQISRYFPKYLWESNVSLLEKALNSNDESVYAENEGNLHLNIANTYFLLTNYPMARNHYNLAAKYKKNFGSKKEEALFYFHMGYTYWQDNDLNSARIEMNRALQIYESQSTGKNSGQFKQQKLTLYKYFALFNRVEKEYDKAINWYTKILNFTTLNKMKIDRARYHQEIAYCYKELGDVDNAISNLDMAQALLKNYQPDEKKYKLKFRVLGYFSFSFWDLGQDAAVIGNNKIFTSLTKRDKELLNISLLEEISTTGGDYNKAIEYLTKKMEIIRQRENKVDNVSMITALNNLGYYNFKLKKFRKAIDYFTKAWKFAVDEDVNDLQGSFNALMNISNIYAYLIEAGSDIITNPVQAISDITAKAVKYRDTYEKERYEQELDALEKEAKAKKVKVEKKEKTELKNLIAQQAVDIYSSIDIAVGVLNFYKAELLSDIEYKVKTVDTLDAFGLFKSSRSLYNLYSDSLKRFNSALQNASAKNEIKLSVKLMQNAASCYAKIGDPDEAYEQYQEAIEISEKYGFNSISAGLYYKIGNFLVEYGSEVEGGGNLSTALSYYNRGIRLVHKYPYLFNHKVELIKDLYNKTTQLLIKMNRWREAFIVSENGYEAAKYYAINNLHPEFHINEDSDDYRIYLNRTGLIAKLLNKKTGLLESGELPESENLKEVNNALDTGTAHLNKLLKNIIRRNSKIASYLQIKKPGIPVFEKINIYKIIETAKSSSLMIIRGGKVNYKNFPFKNRMPDNMGIAGYINESINGNDIYIVLNRESLNLIRDKGTLKILNTAFMFTPSVARVSDYLKPENTQLNKIYYNGKGLISTFSRKGIDIEEGNKREIDYSRYSAIIDDKNVNSISPRSLFSNIFQASMLVKDLKKLDVDEILLLSESALYSGVKSLFLTENAGPADFSEILTSAIDSGFQEVHLNKKIISTIVGIGFKGFSKSERSGKLAGSKKREFELYREYLKSRQYKNAEFHLNRWNSLTTEKTDKINYYNYSADIDILGENYSRSLKSINIAVAKAEKDSKLYRISILKSIYINLYNGKFAEAENLIRKFSDSGIENFYDLIIFRSIIELVNSGPEKSIKIYKNSIKSDKKLQYGIDTSRLKVLYAEFLKLFGSERFIDEILKDWKLNYAVSERETLKISSLNKQIDIPGGRTRNFVDLIKRNNFININSGIQNIIKLRGSYDSVSPVIESYSLEYLIKNSRVVNASDLIKTLDTGKILKNSLWMDKITLLNNIINVKIYNKHYKESIPYYNRLIALLKQIKIPALLKKGLYNKSIKLTYTNNYMESYKTALEGSALVDKDDKLFNRYQLHLIDCETKLNRYAEAEARTIKFQKAVNISHEDEFIFKLLFSRIELFKLSRLKQATIKDAQKFDTVFTSAVKLLDRSPEILLNIKRINLVNEIFDSYINFKLKTGFHTDALEFAEVKKQINLKIKFPDLVKSSFPVNITRELNDRRLTQNRYINILNDYPRVQLIRQNIKFPIEKFQNKIDDSNMLFYTIRVGNDIFIWILNRNFRKVEIIKNGYIRLNRILNRYKNSLTRQNNTLPVSRDLEKLFKTIRVHAKGKKELFFITDDQLEDVPFEIMGTKEMLIDAHKIFYISSVINGLKTLKNSGRTVELIGNSSDRTYNYLEMIALSESGINLQKKNRITGGLGHIHMPLSYNVLNKKMFIGVENYNNIIIKPSYIYLPDTEYYGIGYNDISIYNSVKGVSGIIFNGATVHDINNAVFVDVLYKEINRGSDLKDAFDRAKTAVRRKHEYRHPAYWAGIRLYLNGI